MKTIHQNLNIMVQEGVIYTDGREVKVTPYQLIVGSKEYLLDGITKIRFLTIHQSKFPPIFLMLLGLGGIVCGWLNVFTGDPVNIGSYSMAINQLCDLAGVFLLLTGAIWLAVLHDRYAVRITTAEGEKDAVVSKRRDYISQIVSALHEAVDYKFE